jgi:hypothetical protein
LLTEQIKECIRFGYTASEALIEIKKRKKVLDKNMQERL